MFFLLTLMTVVKAEEEEFDDFMLDDESEVLENKQDYKSTIKIGGLYSSSDSAKFGEYSGVDTRQGYVLGGFDIQHRDAFDDNSSNYWQIKAKDLGLDSRFIRADYGEQGKYALFFEYDQLPHNRLVSAKTPFRNIGSQSLLLADDWVAGSKTTQMPNLADDLKNIDIATERKKYSGGFSLDLTQQWNFTVDIQHEDKEGLQDTGAVMGISGFNPLSVIAPKPIDQETNNFDIKLAYNGDKAQIQLRYFVSLFDNHYNSFSWQNPYKLRFRPESDFLDNVGGLSVAPDNQAHKISLSTAYRLGSATRLSGSFSYGLMNQDSPFMGYTVNPLLSVDSPVPRGDADAEVETLHANLVFTTVPFKHADIRSSYVYDQRDNNTPSDVYAVLRNDSEDQITQLRSKTLRSNLAYGRKQHQFKLDAGYRFLARNKLSIGYGFERNERDYSLVEYTDEHNAHIKLLTNIASNVNSWLKYEYIVREGSGYSGDDLFLATHTESFLNTLPESLRFENDPLIRHYNISDRIRNKLSFSATWLAFDDVNVGFNGRYNDDDYNETQFGLTHSDNFNGTLDINYSLNKGLNLYSFYSYEYFKNEQNGYNHFSNAQVLSTRDSNKLWRVDTIDNIHTVGFGMDWDIIEDTLDFQFDYNFSYAVTQTDAEQDRLLNINSLPDLETTLHSLNLRANYQLIKNTQLQFAYRYEFFEVNDFALDNISPNSINEVLSLGNSSPDYSAHIFAVSVIYQF